MSDLEFSKFEGLRLRLDAKEITDSGQDTVSDANAGKEVTFNKVFADIRSLIITGEKQSDSYGIIGVYDFTDTPNPTEFTAFLYRSDTGAKVTGNFRWIARGI